MMLVEVIKGEKTSDEVFQKSVDFVLSLEHYPVKVRKDIPRFVMNRISSVAFKEALDLVKKGIATVEDVDKGMRYGFNWNIGPFEIADNSGLDTYLRVGRTFAGLEDAGNPGIITYNRKNGQGRAAGPQGRQRILRLYAGWQNDTLRHYNPEITICLHKRDAPDILPCRERSPMISIILR